MRTSGVLLPWRRWTLHCSYWRLRHVYASTVPGAHDLARRVLDFDGLPPCPRLLRPCRTGRPDLPRGACPRAKCAGGGGGDFVHLFEQRRRLPLWHEDSLELWGAACMAPCCQGLSVTGRPLVTGGLISVTPAGEERNGLADGRVGLQDSYCPGGADSATPTPCPAHTTSPAGSSSPAACLAAPGYYGTPGQAAEICPAVRAHAQSTASAGASCTRRGG